MVTTLASARPYPIEPAPTGRSVPAGDRPYHVITMGERNAGPAIVFLHGGGPGCSAWTDFGPVAAVIERPEAG